MQRSRSSLVLVLGALGLVACGTPPDSESATSESSALLTPAPPGRPVLPPPPWQTTQSGGLVGWVDGNGNPTTSSTITYVRSAGTVQHTGSLSYTIWDDFDESAPSEGCGFQVYADALYEGPAVLVAPSGPLLCNGTPYFGDMLPSYPYKLAGGDLLATAFETAAGDTVPDVCEATNNRGTTLATTFLFEVEAAGQVISTQKYTGGYLLATQVKMNVTLVCE